MVFHSQQPDTKKDAVAKPLDKKTRQEILGEGRKNVADAAAIDTAEWSDEDDADIHLAEKEDDPEAKEDVADRKQKSAKPAKQQ